MCIAALDDDDDSMVSEMTVVCPQKAQRFESCQIVRALELLADQSYPWIGLCQCSMKYASAKRALLLQLPIHWRWLHSCWCRTSKATCCQQGYTDWPLLGLCQWRGQKGVGIGVRQVEQAAARP